MAGEKLNSVSNWGGLALCTKYKMKLAKRPTSEMNFEQDSSMIILI
jgi:hypothetical protein